MGNRLAELSDRETIVLDGKTNLKRVLLYGWDGTQAVRVGVDAAGNLLAGGYGTIVPFAKAVTTAGTAVQIVAVATPCKKVVLCADLGNTNPVVVGDSTVVAASGSQKGIVLIPGNDPVTTEIDDLSDLWVDAQTNGDRVCGAYFV
jgi:hypothetical protein